MASKRLITQRKRIIKDVVAQLDANRIVAVGGTYLRTEEDYDHDKQFNGYHNKEKYITPKTCSVCAIGSLFITTVDRYNKLDVGAATGLYCEGTSAKGTTMMNYLSKWWPEEELRIIESAFEGRYYGDLLQSEETPKAVTKAIRWHSAQAAPSDFVLRAICKKLLKHPECVFRTR